ncbi:hypothetical protein B0H10DRAFT_2444070 [Mycena sp. CBHHK59/15]|nr:hypothetical protein B0H10DRAFT_2444070 [Mycena sp. CBHHK59/15]
MSFSVPGSLSCASISSKTRAPGTGTPSTVRSRRSVPELTETPSELPKISAISSRTTGRITALTKAPTLSVCERC